MIDTTQKSCYYNRTNPFINSRAFSLPAARLFFLFATIKLACPSKDRAPLSSLLAIISVPFGNSFTLSHCEKFTDLLVFHFHDCVKVYFKLEQTPISSAPCMPPFLCPVERYSNNYRCFSAWAYSTCKVRIYLLTPISQSYNHDRRQRQKTAFPDNF